MSCMLIIRMAMVRPSIVWLVNWTWKGSWPNGLIASMKTIPTCGVGSKLRIPRTARRMGEATCSSEQGSSSFRFHSGPLTASTLRCFQVFRKNFRRPTCVINLILSEEGGIFEIGATNVCILELRAQEIGIFEDRIHQLCATQIRAEQHRTR